MSKASVAFANMKCALLRAVQTIPQGYITELGERAQTLNIAARHAAYILAKLTPEEVALIHWRRVVPRNGDFGKTEKRTDRQALQSKQLQADVL